jgi:hypothetical protein
VLADSFGEVDGRPSLRLAGGSYTIPPRPPR